MKASGPIKYACVFLAVSSAMAGTLGNEIGVRTQGPDAQRFADEDASRGMWSAERWLMLKSLDSDIKDIAAKESQQRTSGNILKADALRAQHDALRARRAIYERAPD